MKVSPKQFNQLINELRYSDYLLFRKENSNTVWLNWNKLPKDHYLEVGNDGDRFARGYVWANDFNDHKHEVDERGLLKIEIKK